MDVKQWISRQSYRGAFFVLFCLFLSMQLGCNRTESLADKVTTKSVPENPIVIDAPIPIGGKTIEKAWYSVSFRIENKTEKYLNIRAMKFKTQASTKSGSSTLEATATPESGGALSFALLNPGQTGYTNTSAYSNPLGYTCYDGTNISVCPYFPDLIEYVYVGGNPGKPQTENFSYVVETELLGWFSEADGVPIERFNKIVNYVTN